MRRSSPDSTSGRSPDSPDRDVHLTARTGSRDPRRHLFDAVVAAFVAACRAAVLSERTIEFYLEGLNAYRAFAGGAERALTLADLDLDVGRAWLADFVERGRNRPLSPPELGPCACSGTGSRPSSTSGRIPSPGSRCPRCPGPSWRRSRSTRWPTSWRPRRRRWRSRSGSSSTPASASTRRRACGSQTSATGSSGSWARAATSGPSPSAGPSTPPSAVT